MIYAVAVGQQKLGDPVIVFFQNPPGSEKPHVARVAQEAQLFLRRHRGYRIQVTDRLLWGMPRFVRWRILGGVWPVEE